jgi:glycosyltransferase involved in cell wall biosynthesis
MLCQARPEKRIDVAIDVAAEVFRRRPEASVTFVHVGDGECLAACREKVLARGLGPRFVFAGFQNDVRCWIQKSSILLHTAERESFGFALVEAMAFGKPVVAMDAPGPREIIDNGVTGRLIDQGDVVGAAEAVIELISNDEVRIEWGAAARRRAVEKFSLERQAEALAGAIKQVINREPKSKRRLGACP